MSISAADFSVIEPVKENIQPLREGRNVAKLIAAIKEQEEVQHSESAKAVFKQKEQAFEDAIRSYSGDDALVPWLQYIGWIQQTYYSSNLQSKLLPVLERCVECFQANEQYKQDLRFLKLYILYADNVKDAEDIFAFLHFNNIGTSHAIFYRAYYMVLYAKRKYTAAGDILTKGVERRAEPLQEIKNELKRFTLREEKRLARLANDPDAVEYTPDPDEVRKPLANSRSIFSDRGVSSVVSYDEHGAATTERRKGLGGVLTGSDAEAETQRKAFHTQGLGYSTAAKPAEKGNFVILGDGEEEAPGIVASMGSLKVTDTKEKAKEAGREAVVVSSLPALPAATVKVFDDNAATRALDGHQTPPRQRPNEPICGVSPNSKRVEWKKLPTRTVMDKENRMQSSGNIQRDAVMGVVQEKQMSPEEMDRVMKEQRAKTLRQPGGGLALGRPGGLGARPGGLGARPAIAGGLAPGRSQTSGANIAVQASKPSVSIGMGEECVLDRLKPSGNMNSRGGSLLVFED